ncbi:unnamed protein product, partial [Rotaria sp. Silwood1]
MATCAIRSYSLINGEKYSVISKHRNYYVFRNEQAPDLSTEKDRVRVIVRVRPVNNRETEKNDRSVVQCEGENSIL